MRETMVNVLGLVTKVTLLQKWLLISKKISGHHNDNRFFSTKKYIATVNIEPIQSEIEQA